MKVYVYTPDSDRYDSLALANSRDYSKLGLFNGANLATAWRPISARIVKGKTSGDFPSLASHVPALTRRAWDIVRPLVANDVEILPLRVAKHELFVLNVFQAIDSLDLSRSSVERDPDGEVMYIARYAFDEPRLRGRHMFKIDQAPLYEVLVSDEFKQLVENEGLRGLIFRKVG